MCVLHFLSFPIRWVKLLGSHICLASFLNDMHSFQNAFRRKAMEYHPDQNQNNKGKCSSLFYKARICPLYVCWCHVLSLLFVAAVAEEKFKEVMDSYEAIKLERQNGSCWANSWRGTCILAFDTDKICPKIPSILYRIDLVRSIKWPFCYGFWSSSWPLNYVFLIELTMVQDKLMETMCLVRRKVLLPLTGQRILMAHL